MLHLLNLARLDGTTGAAGPRLGGELPDARHPGGAQVFTAPVVWSDAGRIVRVRRRRFRHRRVHA